VDLTFTVFPRLHVQIFIPYSFYCTGWVYLVAFTKVLTMYQIYVSARELQWLPLSLYGKTKTFLQAIARPCELSVFLDNCLSVCHCSRSLSSICLSTLLPPLRVIFAFPFSSPYSNVTFPGGHCTPCSPSQTLLKLSLLMPAIPNLFTYLLISSPK
jgi:phosphatidylglycerophosphate synthase